MSRTDRRMPPLQQGLVLGVGVGRVTCSAGVHGGGGRTLFGLATTCFFHPARGCMMARNPIPTWTFALVVVRLGHRVLVVREAKHGQLWYLPAGRVEAGESLAEGARREVLEETGVAVQLEGIFRIEHTPQPGGGTRCRVFFVARTIDDRPPRVAPTDDSLEARWVTLEELVRMPLRGQEVVDIFRYVADGGAIYPMSLLQSEGAPFGR